MTSVRTIRWNLSDSFLIYCSVGYKINAISHQGVPLPQHEFNSAVLPGAKTAMIKLLTGALETDEAEMRHRFGALFDKK